MGGRLQRGRPPLGTGLRRGLPASGETLMKTTRLTLTRLGPARDLTRHEVDGAFAEIGVMRSRTPV